MFKLAQSLLWSRKKWFFLIVCSLALMLAASLSILISSETIKENLKEAAYQNYGAHSGVLLDVSTGEEGLKKKVDELGAFAVSDSLETDDGKILTVGWFDAEAITLGRFQLIEGDFPKSANEVVIESSYKKLLDGESKKEWEVGETRILELSTGTRELTLTGVLHDYSANWSVPVNVEKGRNDFPNVLTIPADNDVQNYLFKINGSPSKSLNKSIKLTNDFTDLYQDDNFINSRLFYTGLKDYATISSIAQAFQIVVFLLSFISILTLISFYNKKIQGKSAIFKAIGATNTQVFSILTIQYLIMLGVSIVLAIPLSLLFVQVIILNTYNNGGLGNLNWFYIIGVTFLLVLLTGFLLIGKTKRDIARMGSSSIFSLLRGEKVKSDFISAKADRFLFKQLLMQLVTYKKFSALITLTLTLALLVVIMSVFTQKETSGVWDSEVDYFIAAQENYSFDVNNNLTVLEMAGLVIAKEEVDGIEALPFVEFVEKKPFMIDVHPLIDDELMTPSIRNWISSTGSQEAKYRSKWIIPNVKYQILDEEEFEKLFPAGSFEDFKGQALIVLSASANSNQALIDKEMQFVRMSSDENGHDIQEWSYPVYDVIEEEYDAENQSFVVFLDEETASESGILRGYQELNIYAENHLTKEQKEEVESILSEIVSTTPGSLYQKVSDVKVQDMNISAFFGYLGKFSFAVSIVLAMVSTVIMIFGKYKMQRFYWGVYMALGMTRKQVLRYLSLEMFIYLGIAGLVSGLSFIAIAMYLGHVYPLQDYLTSHVIAILFVLSFILIAIYLIKKQVEKQSIYFLLRKDE